MRHRLRDALWPRDPGRVAAPEKELRFTRARQAKCFFFLSVASLTTAMVVLALAIWGRGMEPPLLGDCWWLCLPALLVCLWMLRIALRCTRHAYIILNPLGIEIFPFYKPEENLRVIYWSEIGHAEVIRNRLIVRFAGKSGGGVVVTLDPVAEASRVLLAKAIAGVIEKRQAKVDYCPETVD